MDLNPEPAPVTRRTSTAIRLDPELHAALTDYAATLGVSLNWVVNRLLAEALPHLKPAAQLTLTSDPAPTGRTAPPIPPGSEPRW